MKHYLKCLHLFFYVLSFTLFAQQISVDNSLTVEQLVDNTLSGNCLEISNISSPVNGSSVGINSFGFFQRENSNFPFQDGLMISTGNANSAGNVLNNEVLNEGNPNWTTDSDLENTFEITNTTNATSIEFDFVSIANTVQFNYIFASEEYFANFPCLYSDAFAVLIREAGSSNPYTNIAVIPGTNQPVNNATIHDAIEGFCDPENEAFFEGYNVGDTNFNGRTTVLSAVANITPNVQYHIKFVIADQNDRNYDSAVFIEANSFNPTVNLGNDLTTCAETVLLNGDINNTDATYNWFLDGAPIAGANQPTYEVLQSGNYQVQINVPLGSSFCTIEDDITINLSNTQSSTPMTDMIVCDDISNDGFDVFDLDTKDDEAINSVLPGNYAVSYHITSEHAQNNINPISGNYTNITNPQLIYVRIEDVDNGCLAFNLFLLRVNSLPTISQPSLLEVCDDQNVDGFTTIDLSVVDNEITNGQTNLNVNYHLTQEDADLGINPIPQPYANSSINDVVYVSVSNSQTGCISTTSLNLTILEPPQLPQDIQNYYIDACDSDYDGFAEFDLTSLEPEILNGLSNVSTSYHVTLDEAISGDNPIPNPTNYTNVIETEQTVFIRVVDNTTGCPSVAPIEIHPNLLLSGPNFSEDRRCDNDNDGSEPLNLVNLTEQILGDIPNVSITFYETEDDRTNGINALDTSVDYFPPNDPQTLYLILTSPTCTEDGEIILSLFPAVEFPDIDQETVCDENQDGFTTTDLSNYDALLTQNQPGFTVTYFESEDDADTNTNQLSSIYQNTTNPFIVYSRITANATGCRDISSLEIFVNPAPETNTPNPIIICDNDQDGFFVINLEDTIAEIVSSTNNRNFSFYNNQDDANLGNNPISNPTLYNAQTETVIARIENATTGCISTEPISIIINTLPVFQTISNFRFCENNSDDIGEFLLSTKDDEILNGQTGKEVLYFLMEMDAELGINPIDKNSNFENTTNPQTIFVRVQNLTDPDCFGTSSFTLEVGTNPNFNEPTDVFLCDDGSNDTFVTINLDEKITEITTGITENLNVVFFTSLENLEAGTNPINSSTFTNTTNPQQVFAEIDNGSICTSMTSFTINVIPVPSVTNILPFEACDNDYDGSLEWNLTDAEVNIQDVRLDTIIVEYFSSEAAAEAGTNPINNPQAFTNTANPQTVFVKVTNTDFNCPVILPIELNVNLPPAFNDFQVYEICDTVDDTFDLNIIDTILLDDTNASVTYYASAEDANAQTNPLTINYNYQSANDLIFARMENTMTQCFYVYPFVLAVNDIPEANRPPDLEECDDDFDGNLIFDLTTQNSAILNGLNPSEYNISYHENQVQADANMNPITGAYNAFNNQVIFARLTNTTTDCYSLTQFNIIIRPLPLTNIEDQTICPENFPLVVSAATGIENNNYAWSTGATSPDIEIAEIGTYSVTVTSEYGCSITSTFEVIASEPATIEVVETVDFSDPNNITITITGIGDYLFQLDDGLPQSSNVFENVTLGYHLLTIIDQNGCSSITREVVVIDAPKFLTPNNDGAFDTWHISGVDTLPGTVVYIFDRYGKLLKQLSHTSPGWNGTYNGVLMPTSDYWYSAEIQKNGEAFTVQGHFTLKR